jgi:predicted lipoprotein with Yx(FWY)xxD motif
LLAATAGLVSPAAAQPADLPIAPATTSEYPAGVRVMKTKDGAVYADARGLVLYGMDMRTVLRWSPDASKYCQGECAEQWEPLLAPANAKPNILFPQGFSRAGPPPGYVQPQAAPDWTVIMGPDGPQWVYKGWHMVYTRKGSKAGSTAFEGAENKTWNTLKFVPPVPQIVAPLNVKPVFAKGAYALADKDGHVLFSGNCAKGCTWQPFTGGLASRGVGDWSVDHTTQSPQWRYRGKPVFVSTEDDPVATPKGGTALRP